MRRILSLALSVALVVSAVLPIGAAGAGAAVGQISGVARTQSGQFFAGQLARLRNLQLGHVATVTTTSASGQFSFTGLAAGIYVVELVTNGSVVGTSAPVVLTAREMIASAVAATAAGGGQAQAGVLAGSFWTSTVGIITIAAIAAGVISAVVVATNDESPVK